MPNKIITTDTLKYFKEKQDALNDSKIQTLQNKIPQLVYSTTSDIDAMFTKSTNK